MANSKVEVLNLNLIGQTIAGIVCHSYHLLNDIVIVNDINENTKVVMLSSVSGKHELYTIEDTDIEKVQITNNARMFLFHTNKKQYLVNDQNKVVEDSDQWEAAYFEELSSSFYRKDQQGYWYDIEGFVMKESVFLKDDVLTSLDTQSSLQSISFKNQDLYISQNRQLIQVGKVVLDLNLNVVKYFGEKITGLGHDNIAFEGEDVMQEVKLGLEQSVFINEFTHEPYILDDLKIIKHGGSHLFGQKRIEIFHSEKRSFGVEGQSDHFLKYEEKSLQVNADKYVNYNDSELIKVSNGKKEFYFDLNKNEPFDLPTLEDKVLINIDDHFIRVGSAKVFNVSSARSQFALYESDGAIFTLEDGKVTPQKIEDAKALSQYYGFASIDGIQKLFSKSQNKVLQFGKDALEVSSISYKASDKLINAIDTNGNRLVLDLRHGFDAICLAESEGQKILEIKSAPMKIGIKTLQNVIVETLGGETRRVIDVNEKNLSCCVLPHSINQFSAQDSPSLFTDNFFCEIHLDDELIIEDRRFISADFAAFSGKEYSIILEKDSGNPLHLPGIGHRHELATTWVDYTLKHLIYLGENRMVGVKTISQDLRENELLFSVQQLTSWLPFYDEYLPIFKQSIHVEDSMNEVWDYHLFELAEVTKDKEYVVVEKHAPYRILADKKSGKFTPRIVKSKSKSIKSPDELNAFIRFFKIDASILVEVE